MNIKCPRCGIVHNCNFCPNCGLPSPVPPNQRYFNQPNIPPKRKMGRFLIAFVITFSIMILFIIIGIIVISTNIMKQAIGDDVKSITQITKNTDIDTNNENNVSNAPSDEEMRSNLLEFDTKSWEQFKSLYISHNNLMNAISLYSDSKISSLEFYNYCIDTKKYFQDMSLNFGWGKTDDEKTYLETFKIFALADQQATEHLLKYIDSGKTSDLSKAQESIQRAKDAATTIATNRGILLVKAGLTDEEIHDKVEADMTQLEEEMNE